MMIGAVIVATSFFSFVPTTKPKISSFKYYGDTKPLGYFDPLKLSTDKNSKYLREFELQHGRVAMLASVLIPAFELTKPDTLGINYLSEMDFNSQLPFWYVMALAEFFRMKTAWENPFGGKPLFTLKEDFQPGNYFNYDASKISEDTYNKEINNGRLAMLGAAHMVASEFVTNHPVTAF